MNSFFALSFRIIQKTRKQPTEAIYSTMWLFKENSCGWCSQRSQICLDNSKVRKLFLWLNCTSWLRDSDPDSAYEETRMSSWSVTDCVERITLARYISLPFYDKRIKINNNKQIQELQTRCWKWSNYLKQKHCYLLCLKGKIFFLFDPTVSK